MFDKEAYDLKKGKSNLRMIGVVLVAASVANLAVSFLTLISLSSALSQILTMVISLGFLIAIFKGYPVRWYLFAWYVLVALSLFFLGGQRMVFKSTDGGLAAMFAVFCAMILIGCGIYLAGDEGIGKYLKSIERQGEKE